MHGCANLFGQACSIPTRGTHRLCLLEPKLPRDGHAIVHCLQSRHVMQVAGLAAAVQRRARLAKEEWREDGRGAQQPERAEKRC